MSLTPTRNDLVHMCAPIAGAKEGPKLLVGFIVSGTPDVSDFIKDVMGSVLFK